MKINKTTSFLLYAADLEPDLLLRHGMLNAYLDDHGYEKTNNTKDVTDIFVAMSPDDFSEDFEDLCCAIRSHHNFLDEYDIDDIVIFRMKITDKWAHIKKQLMTSKYSEIDRSYVEEFFPEKTVQSYDKYFNPIYKKSMNHMILHKDPDLKKRWEDKLATEIPEDVELWEKLHMNEEILRFIED